MMLFNVPDGLAMFLLIRSGESKIWKLLQLRGFCQLVYHKVLICCLFHISSICLTHCSN